MNIFVLSIIVLYIIIVLLQYKFTVTNSKLYNDVNNIKFDKEIEYNNNNKDKLKQIFIQKIKERVDLLESGKLSYDDWIEYNKKNVLITIDDHEYYFVVYEEIDENNHIAKVHKNPDYINLTWDGIVKLASEESLNFTKFTIDTQLHNNMFKLSKTGKNEIDYYWFDPITSTPTRKHTIFSRFYDNKTHKTGVIAIGMNIANLNSSYSFKYSNTIHYFSIIVCSLLTLLISLIIILTTGKNNEYLFFIKSIIFMLFSNFYIYNFLNTTELYSSTEEEKSKIKSIHDSVLSISFLTGVNTFILTNLKQVNIKDNSLYFQNTLLFGIGIFLLLLSTFKYTDYINTYELTTDRISLQLIFNFAIIINMLILLNYTAYYLFNKIKFHQAIIKKFI